MLGTSLVWLLERPARYYSLYGHYNSTSSLKGFLLFEHSVIPGFSYWPGSHEDIKRWAKDLKSFDKFQKAEIKAKEGHLKTTSIMRSYFVNLHGNLDVINNIILRLYWKKNQ